MLTAIRGDTNNGWVAVDDFQFIPEVSDCSIVPPEADPNPSSTTDGGDTTMYPPSKSIVDQPTCQSMFPCKYKSTL